MNRSIGFTGASPSGQDFEVGPLARWPEARPSRVSAALASGGDAAQESLPAAARFRRPTAHDVRKKAASALETVHERDAGAAS